MVAGRTYRRICYFLLFSFWLILVLCRVASAEQVEATNKIIEEQIATQKDTNVFKIAAPLEAKSFPKVEQTILQAYSELGISAKIIRMPAKRSLVEAGKNTWVDAELGRVAAAEAVLKDYTRIPVPLITFEISAYTHQKNINVRSWQDASQYRIATIRGFVAITQKLEEIGADYIAIGTVKQVLALEKTGRVDLAIIPNGLISEQQISNKGSLRASVLDTVQVFHYVHNKNREIVPELTKALAVLISKV